MGVTISANNSHYVFDMGGGGFFNLRKNIALAFDKEFGEHYETLIYRNSKEDFKAFDEKANKILSDSRFKDEDSDVLDFLFACDCEGKISYKTCKKIYELIKDIDFGEKIFTYAHYSKGDDYEMFKKFLKECYSHRRKMYWR